MSALSLLKYQFDRRQSGWPQSHLTFTGQGKRVASGKFSEFLRARENGGEAQE
jgi:hypothetical protein